MGLRKNPEIQSEFARHEFRISIMRKLIERKSAIVLIAILVLASLFAVYNQTQAGQLSSVSDTMSRMGTSASSNHAFKFVNRAGVAAGQTITINFSAGFTMGTVDYTDMDLAEGSTNNCSTAVFTDKTLAASAAGAVWGAAVAGRVVTFTSDTDTITADRCVLVRIGTNATFGGAGDAQIVNPAVAGNYLEQISGTFGDSSTIAVYIVANDQVGVGGDVSAPPGGGGAPSGDTTPPIVSNLRVVNILQNSATVLWDTNEPATSRVNYGLSDSYGSNEIGDGGGLVLSHRVDLSGLTADAIYHYDVVTADASGNTTTTADDIFRTLSGTDVTPPVISNIQVINITETGATVTWDTNEPANSKVEYGLTTSYELGQVTAADFVTSHSLALSGLTQRTLYHFRVTSADSSGNTAVSVDQNFTTTAPPDFTSPVISNIRVINITETSATVTWETDEPATSRVRYGLTGAYAAGNIFSGTLTTSHSVDLSGLTRSTLYHFEVSSADASGNLATSSDKIFSTLPDITPPANVSDFTATPTPTKTIMLTWTNPTDPDFAGVLIKRSFTDFPATPADGEMVFDGIATSVEDTGITPANYNQPIYYTAFAYDAAGNFASGATAEATITAEIILNVKAWPEKRWPRTDHWQTRAVVDLQEIIPLPHVVAEETTTTTSLGVSTVTFGSAPLQTYNIGFKGLSHLRKTISGVSLATGHADVDFTEGGTFYLKAGDVHRSKDNVINSLDLSALLSALSGSSEVDDLNLDTTVNSLDINILLANLMEVGDE